MCLHVASTERDKGGVQPSCHRPATRDGSTATGLATGCKGTPITPHAPNWAGRVVANLLQIVQLFHVWKQEEPSCVLSPTVLIHARSLAFRTTMCCCHPNNATLLFGSCEIARSGDGKGSADLPSACSLRVCVCVCVCVNLCSKEDLTVLT